MRFFIALLACYSSLTCAQTFAELRAQLWQRDAATATAQAQRDLTQQLAGSTRRWLNDGARLSVSEQRANNARRVFEQQWQLTLPALLTSSSPREIADADAALADAQLHLAKVDSSALLYRLLGDAQVRQQWQQTQQQRVEAATQLLRDIERRVQGGEAAPDDVTQMQIETQSAQNDLLIADTEQQEMQLQLQQLLGENLDVNAIALPTVTVAEAANANDAHPLRRIAAAESQRAQSQRDWSRDWSRDLEWSLLYKRERSELDGIVQNSSGIGISLPLGDNAARRHEKQQAESARQIAQQRLQQLQQTLPLQQLRADLRLRHSAQLSAQQQQLIRWQTQHHDAVNRAWQLGEMAFADVLRAQQKLAQAQLDALQAQRDMINAQADWLVAYGVLP